MTVNNSTQNTCRQSCLLVAISEILYGIITENHGSIVAGILTLLVCDECNNQCNQQPNQSSLGRGFMVITG